LTIDALRALPHPRAERDLTNELPSQVIDGMLEITRQNYDIAQRWFAHKARLLGLAQLGFEDARAPIALVPPIPYCTAVQVAADTFDALADWAGDIVRTMFSQGQVDAAARLGKHPRPFCQSRRPNALPCVLLTYLGASGDVLSLVHELGHAVHFVVAGRRRDGLTFEAPVPLNEILPALAELLVCDTMIRRESNPGLQHAWAAKQLETCFETIFLSTVLTDFETRAHQMRDAEDF
jgi:oligoendopeptidase F